MREECRSGLRPGAVQGLGGSEFAVRRAPLLRSIEAAGATLDAFPKLSIPTERLAQAALRIKANKAQPIARGEPKILSLIHI